MKSTLQAFPGGPVNMMKGRAAIEGPSQAGGTGQLKPSEIQQRQIQVLYLGRKKILQQYRLGTDLLDHIGNTASSFGTPNTR